MWVISSFFVGTQKLSSTYFQVLLRKRHLERSAAEHFWGSFGYDFDQLYEWVRCWKSSQFESRLKIKRFCRPQLRFAQCKPVSDFWRLWYGSTTFFMWFSSVHRFRTIFLCNQADRTLEDFQCYPGDPRCSAACPKEIKLIVGGGRRVEAKRVFFCTAQTSPFVNEVKIMLASLLNRDFKSFVDLTLEGNWVSCLRTNRFWLSSHIYFQRRLIFTRAGLSNEIGARKLYKAFIVRAWSASAGRTWWSSWRSCWSLVIAEGHWKDFLAK